MSSREKILTGLAACMPKTEEDAAIGCNGCPYNGHPCGGNYQDNDHVNLPVAMIEDIRAMLKAQEPHLLTEADFISNPKCDRNGCLPVWKEYRTGHCGWTKTSAETMCIGMFSYGRQKYRYWSDKPTKEQMEAAPWDALK